MRRRCTYCASRKHGDLYCNIKAKVDLMLDGVPPEQLFDAVVSLESIEDLPRAVQILRSGK